MLLDTSSARWGDKKRWQRERRLDSGTGGAYEQHHLALGMESPAFHVFNQFIAATRRLRFDELRGFQSLSMMQDVGA
jgi:hypothetical protein